MLYCLANSGGPSITKKAILLPIGLTCPLRPTYNTIPNPAVPFSVLLMDSSWVFSYIMNVCQAPISVSMYLRATLDHDRHPPRVVIPIISATLFRTTTG